MSDAIANLAKIIKALSYDEMMEVTGYWEEWTRPDLVDGCEQELLLDKHYLADLLSDWANDNLPDR